MPSDSFDVIVAGAGLAGSLAAAVAAKNGLKVALLDRNKDDEVGKKTNWGWVCGDAVADSHIQYIKSKLDISFDYPELDVKVDGVLVLSPDLEYKVPFEGSGYVLNRPAFEYKLMKYAVKCGAEYMPQFEVEGPIIENNYFVGVFGKDKGMQHREIRAKVVIDALGVATTLRRKLPENPYVDKVVDISDVESTGRYIYDFDVDHQDERFYDPKNALIHLNQEWAPGGYGWVFPKKGTRVNIGIGVQRQSLEIRNMKMNKKDTLHTLMDQYVQNNPVIKNPRLFNDNNNGKGYWSVAVRRQLDCLTFNGYLGAGDSMAMPNPISAGGIGPALISGIMAGEQAVRSIQSGDVSVSGMWRYNLEYNQEYGKKTAGLEVFRTWMQSLNNDTINYGMKVFLTAKEAEDISYGRIPELSITSKAKMIIQGVSNMNAFNNLRYVVKKMKVLNDIYENYPKSIEGFTKWREMVKAEMEEAKSKFQPNPM
ncbi:MAG: NAD(P)/FAD-dependent oxidoreductase [Candidatus Marsarchaeota archaeon]|jgi:geranylgeranyl reductase family protein|nr:NAD(P)/FAD-dependent oxidoreductase [Candidatus Marsarchaeota archaeon]MCL5111457.1 NAD(P)/FAD-dependent oxidoreductase [Candidatus Marsarchaeota archaeon]